MPNSKDIETAEVRTEVTTLTELEAEELKNFKSPGGFDVEEVRKTLDSEIGHILKAQEDGVPQEKIDEMLERYVEEKKKELGHTED